MKERKWGLELSIGTLVVIVLAMAMLILGLLLIQRIFEGAKYNVDTINNKVRDEINKLFSEERQMVVYLANNLAEIKQGDSWGVAFAVKNLESGTVEAKKFTYATTIEDENIKQKCGISSNEILKWIATGETDSFSLPPGQTSYRIVRLEVPKIAPLCTVRFNVEVKANGQVYTSDFFDVKVKA